MYKMSSNALGVASYALKTHQESQTGLHLGLHYPTNFLSSSNSPCKDLPIHDFTISVIFFFIFFFSKPAILILERVDTLIFLLNVSRVGGDVHGPQAIVSFRLHVSLRFHRGALHGRRRTMPFSANSACIRAGSRDIAACSLRRTDC